MSANHPAGLDRAFQTAVERARAIFAGAVDERPQGIGWVEALTGATGAPLRELNQYCLEHRVNGVCLTRCTIHLFRPKASGAASPHNSGAAAVWRLVVDSG